ncbi:OmpA family protein [Ravibacter arvi]|uniref:OmpA family protein n=1 Tax=Ravibacter arvi TaxID=2051041 RepID=A0ABP8M2B0_9BACT
MRSILVAIVAVFMMGACVSKKKALSLENEKSELQAALDKARTALSDCDTRAAGLSTELKKKSDEVEARNRRLKELEEQNEYLKKANMQVLDRFSDLSIVTKQGAESIKKSMETLNQQGKYIQDLNKSIQQKDSLNMVLVNNLKRSLSGVSEDDVQVEVKKGVVYVSLSDKMLFRSGSSIINAQAEGVVGNVAKILNDYKQIEILVEGHTDNVPFASENLVDNWDLSVKRATSVVRLLQKKYGVDPARLTAGGRGEYAPKASNATSADRSVNRRTEIIITPKMDQYFNLYTDPDQNK